MENLKCGCGGEIDMQYDVAGFGEANNPSLIKLTFFDCKKCGVSFSTINKTQSEAIAAFRIATRADIKQGIQWISVKDDLPEDKENENTEQGIFPMYLCLVDGQVSQWAFIPKTKRFVSSHYLGTQPTHWAEINLPEKDNQ